MKENSMIHIFIFQYNIKKKDFSHLGLSIYFFFINS